MLCEDISQQAVAPVSVTVITQWGDEFPFTITDKKVVDDVKALVEKRTGVERCNQMLTLDGHRVRSSDSLKSLGASQDSCFRVYAGRDSQGSIKLRLRSLAADEKCLQVDPMQTVLECKELYEERTEIPWSQIECVYDGQIMENNLTLLDYKVTASSIVHVVFRHFPIFIWTQQHKFYSMRVNAKTTVLEIKAKIYEHEGVEIKEQRLAYRDFEMENDMELAYYHAAKPNAVFRLLLNGVPLPAGDQRSDVARKKATEAEQCTIL